MLELQDAIARLEHNATAIERLVAHVDHLQAHWKPSAEEWSMVEVINHLYDEEREDFRTRLDLILHQPETTWPPIDPQGWVTSRHYNERTLDHSIADFLSERQRSLVWLQTMEAPNWTNRHIYPGAGSMSAAAMLAAWVAHDYLHLRQLAQLNWQYIAVQARPDSIEYAGDW